MTADINSHIYVLCDGCGDIIEKDGTLINPLKTYVTYQKIQKQLKFLMVKHYCRHCDNFYIANVRNLLKRNAFKEIDNDFKEIDN